MKINNKKIEEMKDEKLNYLIDSKDVNIAQFISFEPNENMKIRFACINNFENKDILQIKDIIKILIFNAPSNKVNIRSFSKESMKGNKLIINKGIEDIDEIIEIIKKNSLNNKYSIINENIDINDCGVSGVVLGDVIEFSPEDTPKCVEKEGVCSLPRDIGMEMLKKVYGFEPNLKFEKNNRIEFSVHPNRQGVKKEHTIIWEYEQYEEVEYSKKILWPNNFSKFIGDKVFGLLIAEILGFAVPTTTVISRKIAPFTFGEKTGMYEKWIRTCPVKKEPGKFFTGSTWCDPFKLIEGEEKKGELDINIASVISQDAVEAIWSGASFIRKEKKDDVIEGVSGNGDKFMVGEEKQEELPTIVIEKVEQLNNKLREYNELLGDISIEWVYDGSKVWIVQLNQLKNKNNHGLKNNVIVSGNPIYYEKVFTENGLEGLREKIKEIKNKNIGIELIGNIGVTSHFGDLLRLNKVPSILNKNK